MPSTGWSFVFIDSTAQAMSTLGCGVAKAKFNLLFRTAFSDSVRICFDRFKTKLSVDGPIDESDMDLFSCCCLIKCENF
jgi:hypothetical protein